MPTSGHVTPDLTEMGNEELQSLATGSLENSVEPATNDIVLSKGWVRHPGNMNFHRVAERMGEAYGAANLCGKVFVTQLLVHTIAERNSHFLVKRSQQDAGWRKASTTESFKVASNALQVFSAKAERSALQDCRNPDEVTSQSHSGMSSVTHDPDTRSPHFLPSQRPRQRSNGTMASLQETTLCLQRGGDSSSLSSLQVEVGDVATEAEVQAFTQALVGYSQIFPHVIQSLHIKLSPLLLQASAKQLALGIRRCRGLRTLRVQFHGARRKFALLLVAAAIGNSTVTSLHLNGNRLGDRGALWIFCILQSCTRSNLQYISLEDNAISAAGAMAVRRVLGSRGRTIRTVLGDGDCVSHDARCRAMISGDDENEKL